MQSKARWTLSILSILFLGWEATATDAHADAEPVTVASRIQQRQEYRAALQYLKTNRITQYRRLKTALQTYPLYPYLEYQEIVQGIKRRSEADILAFVNQYQDTPLAERLGQRWLTHLAKRGRWGDFINYYEAAKQPVTLGRKLACHHAFALYREGRLAEAMAHAKVLWLVAYSQPDECDALFKFWRAKGGITAELAWQRLAMSIRANQRQLAAYLLRFINEKDRAAATNFLALRDMPARIKQTRRFQAQGPRYRESILYGVTQFAWTDPEAALGVLRTYGARHDFDPEPLESAYARVGQYLAQKTDNPILSLDLPVNLHTHPELAEEIIRQALRHLNWEGLLAGINLLPPRWQAEPRWQYWKARARYSSEHLNEQQEAREILLALSQERTFYGFLAADLLDTAYNYRDEMSAVTQEQLVSLELSPGMQRALELFALKERGRARQEWNFTTAEFRARELEVAAALALQRGWYKVAIQAMIDAGTWNYLHLRFPLAWQESFSAYAARADIPLSWSLAIARQESAFMPDAKSPSGALGLMQILPTTATMIARSMKIKYRNRANLIIPEFSIKLGSHYLGSLFHRYDNNRILASAAYNTGPGHVDHWLAIKLPVDVWIEVIPITETRTYVQNILMYSSIYSRRLGESMPLIYPHERAFFSATSAAPG